MKRRPVALFEMKSGRAMHASGIDADQLVVEDHTDESEFPHFDGQRFQEDVRLVGMDLRLEALQSELHQPGAGKEAARRDHAPQQAPFNELRGYAVDRRGGYRWHY